MLDPLGGPGSESGALRSWRRRRAQLVGRLARRLGHAIASVTTRRGDRGSREHGFDRRNQAKIGHRAVAAWRTNRIPSPAARRWRNPSVLIVCCPTSPSTARSSVSGRTRTSPSSRPKKSSSNCVRSFARCCSARRRCRSRSRSSFRNSRATPTRARSTWRKRPMSMSRCASTAGCAIARGSIRAIVRRGCATLRDRRGVDGTDVLVDDRPMPCARALGCRSVVSDQMRKVFGLGSPERNAGRRR